MHPVTNRSTATAASTAPDSWNRMLQVVLRRAASDADFRRRCLQEPREAIKEAGEIDLPPGRKIKFVEHWEEIVIPLPPFQGEGAEITDEELLETTAGGRGYVPPAWEKPPVPR